MKNYLLLFCFSMSLVFVSKAQNSNAIFFTENGERFQVVLNGILQNAKAETNVKLTDLNAPSYKSRIIFEDTKLGSVDFNLYFPSQAIEVTWDIKKNKKGEYVVRYVSDIPIAQAPPSPPTQSVVVYTTTPATSVSTSTTTTTTTAGSGGAGDNINVSMGVIVSENGGGMSVNMSGMEGGTSTTTTTTTHSSSVSGTAVEPVTQVVYVDGYNGTIGCARPMQHNDFAAAKQSIQSKSFEESKLTVAKQVFNNNCLTSAQVKEIMLLFSFEESKLDFAKYAYGYTYDPGNYFKVNDAFTFESSIDDLDKYINSYKR